MPRYIVLWNWTEQGIKEAKDSPKRVAEAKDGVEKAGGKWIDFYYTMGEYDGVLIMELPNDEKAMSLLLAIGIKGSVRTKTLKAFPEDEAAKAIEGLP